MVRLVVLGAAAGGGFPQWNGNDAAARRARAGDPEARPRTQSSLAVSADGERWVLINASPDLRQQIEANPPLHPRHGKRDSPIAAVVLTNGDVDHIAGLLSLRENQPLAVYATGRVLAILRDNTIFNVLNPEHVDRRAMALGAAFEVADRQGRGTGVQVEAFAVPGKVALHREDPTAGANFGTEPEDTVGLCISARTSDAACFYIPGCAAMTPELAARLRGTRLLLFDGTLYRDDEMIAQGVGAKTGRRMGHISVSGPGGAIAACAPLGIARKIFVHVNNTNPILLDDSPERAAVAAAGWEVAHDGLAIEL
jgi:pyrroloquinoline quinone biosynthesis protein B